MNYDQMIIAEMEEIYRRLGKEIERRRDAEKREDWNKLANQIRLFIERHGEISVTDEINEEYCINRGVNFEELGMIYLPRY